MWEPKKTESYTTCSGKKSLSGIVASHPRETGRDVAIGKCLRSSAFRGKNKEVGKHFEVINLYNWI